MNLNNLKTYVPAKLYERGLDYFEKDFVEQLTEDAPNRWHALVAGTRDYEVSVNLAKDGTIVGSYCTCPFESDSLCKHEVAVCLAIRENKKENGSSAVDIQARLKSLKKAELLEILEELVEKQPTVQLYLKEKFADPNGMDEEKARRLIQKSASRASRRGFIEWERTDQALEGVWEVLEYLDGLNSPHDAERIIRLSFIIINECTEMLQIADDSSGGISSAIYESLDKISEALAEWPEDLDEATVDGMLELLYPHILFALEQDITDAASHLVEAVLQWNERGGFTEKFYNFIADLIASDEMQNKTYKYTEERFHMYQLAILRQQGRQELVEAFYTKYRHYPAIRKAQVRQALDAGEFEKVIRLCDESEQLDANFAGLLNDWKKLRFEAYEGMGNTEELIGLSFEFALDGEEEYYYKLRSLVDVERWPEKLEALLAEMKSRPRSRPLYLSILIDEKRLEELLDYCRTDVSAIEHLHPHLVADYPHEVNEIYTTYIYRQIERASNRKAYWSACQKIKGFQQALGAEAATGLIEELKFMYPKRKALLDELERLSKD
ncbi:SWIM zinc finger family protein [Planococcus sp. N064]|uniref:SWIM zinc finger family protein n=1 Tax=Planococcus liqunii TaxID=3058394 RepID=A0ABT8MR65_9BACL|nr:SWIM zinc finger family protein [Planococcus sp. N064]MDN7227334.1 SWIM zinc finger family protein [Planococcus sp. N064]